MEQMIRQAIQNYGKYESEAKMQEQWLKSFKDPLRQKRLNLLEMKLAILDCWFGLLNEDERYVVRRHLIDEIEWARIDYEFRERWGDAYGKTDRTLQKYQTNALNKILAFCVAHIEVVAPAFSDLLNDKEGGRTDLIQMIPSNAPGEVSD